MNRRTFLSLPPTLLLAASTPDVKQAKQTRRSVKTFEIAAIDRERILIRARSYLRQQPITITASRNPRSAGGLHDFSSEGDYWWRDPNNPEGAYIQRDGLTNPDNFTAHREALMRLSQSVPTLVAAWKLTKNRRYAVHAAKHLRAWFINPATLMNPNLLYAQAIKNKVTGRGIGIIDTIHLVEVARAATHLEASNALGTNELQTVKNWFARYLTWMTTHPYGIDEREAKNNHGTCWVMQVAEFARFTGNTKLTAYCRDRFKRVLVPTQIAADGSFPLELSRTKPYGYALLISMRWRRCAGFYPRQTITSGRTGQPKGAASLKL